MKDGKDREERRLVHDGIADGNLLDIYDEIAILDGEKRVPKKDRNDRPREGVVVVVKKKK